MADLLGDQWIDTKEAARLTGYAIHTVSRLCRESKIKCVRVGRDWLVSRESLMAYLDQAKSKDDGRYGPGD